MELQDYFYKKAVEIVTCGANVIFDYGFLRKNERDNASKYFSERNIPFEWHYIDVSDDDWKRNIEERNKLVCENQVQAYFVDEGLLQKIISKFEKPTQKEIDIWVDNSRK